MKRLVPLLLLAFFGLIGISFWRVLADEFVKVSQGESVLACGASVDPRYSLILQPQTGGIQAVKGLAESLYLNKTPITYRECAYDQGNVLVVDNLTSDEALCLRRAFVGNLQDVDAWIHQRPDLPFQSI